MKVVSFENLLKYNELLNPKTAQTIDVQHNFSKNVMTNKVLMAVV